MICVPRKMKTNEDMRILADRRIHIDVQTANYDLLGNCSGDVIAVGFNMDIDLYKVQNKRMGECLVLFTNDNGFSEEDKHAYHEKNTSGNNSALTASVNGLGEALVIDRLIPKDHEQKAIKRALTISINNDNYWLTTIGTFDCTDWIECNELKHDIQTIIKKLTGDNYYSGSLKIIPLSEEWAQLYSDSNDPLNYKKKNIGDLSFQCQKFLNRRLRDGNKLYVNGKEAVFNEFAYILSDDPREIIQLNYSLGFDTEKTKEELGNHKHSLIIKIHEIEKFRQYPWASDFAEFIQLKVDPKNRVVFDKEYKISNSKGKLCIVESGTIFLGVDKFSSSMLNGLHVYLNNNNVNWKPIVKNLGGKAGKSGSGGAFDQTTYMGFPRFENHVSKNSIQYQFPQDKSNISPTPKGDLVIVFIRRMAERWRHYKPPSNTITTPETTEVQAGGGTLEDYHSQSPSASSPPSDNLISPTPILYQHQQVRQVQQTEVSEPYRKVEISDELKDNVWNRFFRGKFLGNCPCCNIKITLFKNNVANTVNFGHIIAERNGGPTKWQNIIPVCRHCNQSMRTTNMIDWVKSKYSPERFQKFELLLEQYLTNSDDYAVNS